MKSIIRKLIPAWVKSRIISFGLRELASKEHKLMEMVPHYCLSDQHVRNLVCLKKRSDLLAELTRNAVVAEIGVDMGLFSKKILEIAQPLKLHLVDNWNGGQFPAELKSYIESEFETEIKSGTVKVNLGDSVEVASRFENEYFDWIYIDSTHSYEQTKNELSAYAQKVKKGGVIAGHDYIQGNWSGKVRYGVIEAVNEFCVTQAWELIYLTLDVSEHPSFAIKKL